MPFGCVPTRRLSSAFRRLDGAFRVCFHGLQIKPLVEQLLLLKAQYKGEHATAAFLCLSLRFHGADRVVYSAFSCADECCCYHCLPSSATTFHRGSAAIAEVTGQAFPKPGGAKPAPKAKTPAAAAAAPAAGGGGGGGGGGGAVAAQAAAVKALKASGPLSSRVAPPSK